jgi:uncharacterized protein YukE
MPDNIIKMDYPAMEGMEKTFREGTQMLEDTLQKMTAISTKLDDGALLGMTGEAMSTAIREGLCTSIKRLNEKYTELAGDIRSAMNDMKAADQKSGTQFR